MSGWQIAILVLIIGVSQTIIGYFYMRPRAITRQNTSAYSKWKLLLFIGLLVTIVGLVMLLLPESLWWT
jgi:cytochrome c oxidase assembly factor CtaG